MQIQGSRISLRLATKEDLDFLCEIDLNQELWHFSSDMPDDRGAYMSILIDRMENDDNRSFIIQLNDNKRTYIGRANIWRYKIRSKSWEISYAVIPDYQNKGFCTEAVKLLLQYAFADLQAHKVVGTCNAHNIASSAVMQSVGMTREAVFREELFWNNQWVDQFFYGVLDREREKFTT